MKKYQYIHELVNTISNKHKNKIAIKYGKEEYSYFKLLIMVNNLLKKLSEYGVKEGDIIQIIGQKSPSVIISILASWSIGATIALIDKNISPKRKQEYKKQIDSKISINCSHKIKLLGENFEVSLKENELFNTKIQFSERRIENINDKAYIIFTSGSTGKSKIILGSHQGLSHFLLWQKNTFKIDSNNNFANFTNISFDVYFRDVFLSLISGGTLFIPEINDISPMKVFKFIKNNNINSFNVVPSIASLWLQNGDIHQINSLKLTFFAGEMLTKKLIYNWINIFPNSQVINLYGPSETTLAKCFNIVNPSNYLKNENYSVGKNIKGSRIFILNNENDLCKIDEFGEICIKTNYMSYGYIIDNKLKEHYEKITLNKKTYKIFRTGDIGYINNNKELVILGRKDSQIKINGVRIDLEEINNVIETIKGVNESFICCINKFDFKLIVVFINSEIKEQEYIIEELKKINPDLIIPSKIYFIDSLKRNANGKIDRRHYISFAKNDINKPVVVNDMSAKGELLKLWIDTLNINDIGYESNFFDKGGNSLLITILCEKINKKFNKKINVIDLFQYSTINQQYNFLFNEEIYTVNNESHNNIIKKRNNFIMSRKSINKLENG